MAEKKVSIQSVAEGLRDELTFNSQWGETLTAEHLHDLARSRRIWPSPFQQGEVVVFAAMLHKFREDGNITLLDIEQIMLTLNVNPPDAKHLTDPGIVVGLLQREFTSTPPHSHKDKKKRKQQKEARRNGR